MASMLKAFLQNRVVSVSLIIGMIAVTSLCILPTPDVIILKRISAHAIQIMILLLGGGLFFFALNQKRLLFTAFGCVAALCLHFRSVANISLIKPIKTSEPTFIIAQSSTADFAEHWQSTIASLIKTDADILSILEITPDWEDVLRTRLTPDYPYYAINTRIDIFGSAIFSKFPLSQIDTLMLMDVPTLKATVDIREARQIQVYSINTNPPLFRISLLQLRNQLRGISSDIVQAKIPCIASGDFNLDQFADEIQDFRAKAGLLDSRKTMSPSLYTPTTHIFYSRSFECLRFSNLYDLASVRIGIMGEYQLKRYDMEGAD